MPLNAISLTGGLRSNLFSLQKTADLLDRTQRRLSSGKKVNTAIDNPTAFFAAQALLDRAADLSARKDGVSESIQSVNAAVKGITAISNLLESATGIASAALGTSDQTARTAYAEQFDEILSQIDTLAADSGYKGTNLLKNQSLLVDFSEVHGQSTLTITGTDATIAGLGV